MTDICRYGPWVKFGFVYNPLFKGFVWFWRDDRGVKERWPCRTLGMDGVQ